MGWHGEMRVFWTPIPLFPAHRFGRGGRDREADGEHRSPVGTTRHVDRQKITIRRNPSRSGYAGELLSAGSRPGLSWAERVQGEVLQWLNESSSTDS